MVVHGDGAVRGDAAGLGQLDPGPDPGGHDDEVAGDVLPGGHDDLGDVSRLVHHGVGGAGAQEEAAALVLKHLLVHPGGVVIGLQGHDPVGHLRDGHLRPPVAQGRGGVQTHQTGAHDKHPLAPGQGPVDLQRVAEIPETEDVGGLPEVGDGGDEEPRAGGDEELVVGGGEALAEPDGLFRRVDPVHPLAGDVDDVVLVKEVLPDKADAGDVPLPAQELVEHAAGVDVLVDGDDGDHRLGLEVPQHLGGGDAGGAGADNDVTLHFPYTSLTSMAFLGQARTQAGPSSRWTQKSHLIIRFRSGEMAGTP